MNNEKASKFRKSRIWCTYETREIEKKILKNQQKL